MAPPASNPTGLTARLTAKAGPLPVWAWAAVILGAYLLYSRFHVKTPSTAATDSTATPDSSAGSSADTVSSGQGGAADNLSQPMFDALSANTGSLDALTQQLLSLPVGSGFGPTDPVPGDPGPGPGPTTIAVPTIGDPGPTPGPYVPPPAAKPTAPVVAAAPPPSAHATQTTAGKLSWGGVTFTSQKAFDAWAKAHGSSTTAELRNHPQARAIYSTLK